MEDAKTDKFEYSGLKDVVDFYNKPVEEDKDTAPWTVFDPKAITSSITGVDPIVIKVLMEAIQERMVEIEDNLGGFANFFLAADHVCNNIEDYPVKGDPKDLCNVVAVTALGMASSYYGYIHGYGDARMEMEPKNRQERRHGVIRTP